MRAWLVCAECGSQHPVELGGEWGDMMGVIGFVAHSERCDELARAVPDRQRDELSRLALGVERAGFRTSI